MALGYIAFLGSGETSLAGGRIFETLARALPPPLEIAILETPAGFELNANRVAGRVADFLEKRLENYAPNITTVPARKRGTPFSPDDPEIVRPLLTANLIFLGPGSPTYAVRQLKDSLAWDLLRARHRRGTALVFASAATIAAGAWALPVYEIFKVGEDVHQKPGLNLFADFGLNLNFIPHWNNAEGGAELDTSRCFVGRERFDTWYAGLPPGSVVVGLDEHTGLLFDFEKEECLVSGVSSVSILRNDATSLYAAGSTFPLRELGHFAKPQPLESGIPASAWEMVLEASAAVDSPPPEALALLEARRQARARKDWAESDRLREQIAALGWQVQDTPDGQKFVKA
ncbi:MAG: hypothetical protein Fur0043_06720 [Anaerolineales bacterium]